MQLSLMPMQVLIQTCTECDQQLPETGERRHLSQVDIEGAAGNCPKCGQPLPKKSK